MKKSEKFFSTLLEEWLEQTKEQVKHSTYCKYEQITRLHLKPYFKSIDCALISQEIIRAFYESLNQDPSNEKKTVYHIASLCVYDFESYARLWI